jgi:hypothetical protein
MKLNQWREGGTLRIAARMCALLLLAATSAFGWGGATHRLINLKACMHLPPSMGALKADSFYYQAHASDPDYRKNSGDTSFFAESPRHYIDIDNYPNFHTMPHALDSVIFLYGRSFVRDQGTLPWIVPLIVDSLTAWLASGNIAAAESAMSDIGHYVADAHQPLHATANYDGYATGNGGIHSRYETGMMNIHLPEIVITQDSARYITSPLDFMFEIIMRSNALAESVLIADTYARTASGWNGTGTPPAGYYDALWEKTQGFTREQIQRATVSVASLWYTAFRNAQVINAVLPSHEVGRPEDFTLRGNYPNPFNPSTAISFSLGKNTTVHLTVYTADGRAVATLLKGETMSAGEHTVSFDGSGCASGVYYYRLEAGNRSSGGKMVLCK